MTGKSIGLEPELVKKCGEGVTGMDTEATRLSCVSDYIKCRGNTPQAMGRGIAFVIAYDYLRDGWNSEGDCGDAEFCSKYGDVTTPDKPKLYEVGQGACGKVRINK